MKRKISDYCVRKLIESNTIKETEIKIYAYGIEEGLTIGINWCLTIILGFFWGQVYSTIFFLVVYMLLRSYAGGYHAINEKRCFWYSIMLIVICEIVLKFMRNIDFSIIIFLYCLAIYVIINLAPMDSKNKPLSSGEAYKFYKKVIVFLYCNSLMIFIFCFIGRFPSVTTGIILAVYVEAIMLCMGKLNTFMKSTW